MMTKDKPKRGKDKTTGRFVAGNTYGFQKGKVSNPNGRPRKDRVLEALNDELGEIPREILVKVLDQATTGRNHFSDDKPLAKAIEKISMKEVLALCIYLDEQFNGRATTNQKVDGTVIVLPQTAENL